MKTTLLISGISILFCLVGCENRSSAPQLAMDTFDKSYPNATEINWEQESENEWEAEFKLDGVEYSANFLSDGTWLETEHDITQDMLPAKIYDVFLKSYPNSKIESIEKIESEAGVSYEIECNILDTEMSVVLDSNGRIIKEEVSEETEENDAD